MKLTLIFALLFSGVMAYSAANPAHAPQSYNFQFKTSQSKAFSITQKATSKEQAYKMAATECFKKLTNNKYPGEEKGLEIIDICANPKM